jgi:ribosomal protein S18 acetylase RimI-like enzyme
MMALQEQVVMGLPDQHLFVPIDEEFVVKHVREAGAAFGVSDGDQLIAYGLLTVPASAENLSRDLPHCEINPQDVAHMESCVVHPAYRGLGIQRQLTQLRLRFAMEKGIGHILMTISPKNFHSLHNQINCHGFKVRNLKFKYSGVWRFILHRKVQTAEQSLIPDEWCPVDDIDRLQRIFSLGMVGVAIQPNSGRPQLGYASERRNS